MSILLQEFGLSDCTVEVLKEDCELYEGTVFLLGLRNNCYKCVYINMLFESIIDVSAVLCSNNFLIV